MSNRNNSFAIAKELATQEAKYQDNKVIQSILSNFNTKLKMFQLQHSPKYYDPLSAYLEALDGQTGCSLMLGSDTITNMMTDPIKRLIDLAVLQALAEQLIFALQAEGEEIDY